MRRSIWSTSWPSAPARPVTRLGWTSRCGGIVSISPTTRHNRRPTPSLTGSSGNGRLAGKGSWSIGKLRFSARRHFQYKSARSTWRLCFTTPVTPSASRVAGVERFTTAWWKHGQTPRSKLMVLSREPLANERPSAKPNANMLQYWNHHRELRMSGQVTPGRGGWCMFDPAAKDADVVDLAGATAMPACRHVNRHPPPRTGHETFARSKRSPDADAGASGIHARGGVCAPEEHITDQFQGVTKSKSKDGAESVSRSRPSGARGRGGGR